jgi:hypothetical protein
VLLPVLTLLELKAGLLSAIGVPLLLLSQNDTLAGYGLLTAAVCFVALFFGQRLAKDYAGSANMTTNFLLAVVGLYLYTL